MASTEAAAYYPRALRIGEILRRSRMASAGLTLGAVLGALAAFAPLVATADPTAMAFSAPFARPGLAHPFGAALFGRALSRRVVVRTVGSGRLAAASLGLAPLFRPPPGRVGGCGRAF